MSRRRTKLAAALLAALSALGACVPASEPPPPAGAAGARLEPSPAARGEPFMSDGWRVTVEKLVLRLEVSAQSVNEDEYSSGYERYLVDAARPADVFASGLRVGPTRVTLLLSARYFYDFDTDADDHVALPGVTADDLHRFDEVLVPSTDPYSLGLGASALVVLRGERGASSVTVQTALASSWIGHFSRSAGCPSNGRHADEEPPLSREETRNIVDVRANDIALARVEVLPEATFSCGIGFAQLAAADANGDGIVDTAELTAAPGAQHLPTLLDLLSLRVGSTLLRWVDP